MQNPRRNTPLARELRSNATLPERVLWKLLRDRRRHGLKFRRQQPVGPFVADFYCASARLVVEIDGMGHDARADAGRDEWMRSEGIEVLRIPAKSALDVPERVAELIAVRAKERISEIERS